MNPAQKSEWKSWWKRKGGAKSIILRQIPTHLHWNLHTPPTKTNTQTHTDTDADTQTATQTQASTDTETQVPSFPRICTPAHTSDKDKETHTYTHRHKHTQTGTHTHRPKQVETQKHRFLRTCTGTCKCTTLWQLVTTLHNYGEQHEELGKQQWKQGCKQGDDQWPVKESQFHVAHFIDASWIVFCWLDKVVDGVDRDPVSVSDGLLGSFFWHLVMMTSTRGVRTVNWFQLWHSGSFCCESEEQLSSALLRFLVAFSQLGSPPGSPNTWYSEFTDMG